MILPTESQSHKPPDSNDPVESPISLILPIESTILPNQSLILVIES